MGNPASAVSYLARAQGLCKTNDRASLIYAALELRCGVEARLQAHASVAIGVSKAQAEQWEIKRLGRTLDEAFGFGDSMLIVFVNMHDGRSCQFMYAPVSKRLQEIAKRCGDYLHALRPERVSATEFFFKYCDGKFTDEDLSDEGNSFASKYYGDEGLYLEDYAESFGELMYVAPESAHDFQKFSAMLGSRFSSGLLTRAKKKQ